MIDLNSGSENGDSAYGSTDESSIWTTPSLEDPLRIPENGESDGSLISNLFNNNNDRAKDLGFTTSESEFISLDRFDDRNRTALVVLQQILYAAILMACNFIVASLQFCRWFVAHSKSIRYISWFTYATVSRAGFEAAAIW